MLIVVCCKWACAYQRTNINTNFYFIMMSMRCTVFKAIVWTFIAGDISLSRRRKCQFTEISKHRWIKSFVCTAVTAQMASNSVTAFFSCPGTILGIKAGETQRCSITKERFRAAAILLHKPDTRPALMWSGTRLLCKPWTQYCTRRGTNGDQSVVDYVMLARETRR